MPKFGFYDYDKAAVGSDGVIYKEDLTSEPASGYTETNSGITFTSAGMTIPSAGTSGGEFSGISGQDNLDVEGTVQFLISAEAFDKNTNPDSGSNANFINFKTGTLATVQKNGTSGFVKFTCSGTIQHKKTATDQWYYDDSDAFDTVDGLVKFMATWDQGGIKCYVDDFKVADLAWPDTGTRPNFTEIYLGSIGAASGGNYTYKNLLISTKKTVIKQNSHKTAVICVYGDSYLTLGGYPQVDGSGKPSLSLFSSSDQTAGNAPYFTEDGNNGDNFDASSGIGMSNILPATHKYLAKRNLFTDKIHMWGEGGSGYVAVGGASGVDVEARVDVALTGEYMIPDVAVVVAGYNDATSGATSAAIQTAGEGIIAALKAANADVKIIMTTAPYNSVNTGAGFSASLAEVQAVNTGITAAAADSSVKLIDIYTIVGGASGAAEYFRGDDIHPSPLLGKIYGKLIARAIQEFVVNGNNSTISAL